MIRNVEFYRIKYKYLPLLVPNVPDEQLKEKLISCFINSISPDSDYTIPHTKDTGSTIIIETMEITPQYLFGVIGKLEDLKGGILKRLRKKENYSILNNNIQDIDYYIENYTYFYFRFSDLICAVLSNSSAPRFKTHFQNYLKYITNHLNLEYIRVVNVFDKNIDYKINQLSDINEIKMIYDDSSNIGNELLNLKDAFDVSQTSLREARVVLSLEMKAVSENTKEILKDSDLIKSNFKKLELMGKDIQDKEIQVELVEQLLSKKVEIQIDKKYLQSSDDLDKIKGALIKALPLSAI